MESTGGNTGRSYAENTVLSHGLGPRSRAPIAATLVDGRCTIAHAVTATKASGARRIEWTGGGGYHRGYRAAAVVVLADKMRIPHQPS